MAMEKQGVVDPNRTNDTEKTSGEKQATGSKTAQTKRLDDDFTKRAADKAADGLTSNGS